MPALSSPQFLGQWEAKGGSASLERVAPGILRIVIAGHLTSDQGAQVARALDDALNREPRSSTYWDLGDMVSYDPSVRVDCTNALLAHDNRGDVVVFAKSLMVRMGVSVANMVLSGTIRSVHSREQLEQAMTEQSRQRPAQAS